MKFNNLKDKATEELDSELKVVKVITGSLLAVVTLLFGICLYGLLTKENNTTFMVLMIVAFSCGMIIPINFLSIKNIKKELELREQSNT